MTPPLPPQLRWTAIAISRRSIWAPATPGRPSISSPMARESTVTRDVIETQSCNTCHDQLAFHGGYAQGFQMCVLCHQPQNADPVTGNTLDAKVFFHKLHMGSQLPSVVGTATTPGVPYQIIGYMNSVNDFSTVMDPARSAPLRGLPQPDHQGRASQGVSDGAEPGGLRSLPRRCQFRHRRRTTRAGSKGTTRSA